MARPVKPLRNGPRDIIEAANLHERANPSDPFARARIVLHMQRGIAYPNEVAEDARKRLGTGRT